MIREGDTRGRNSIQTQDKDNCFEIGREEEGIEGIHVAIPLAEREKKSTEGTGTGTGTGQGVLMKDKEGGLEV